MSQPDTGDMSEPADQKPLKGNGDDSSMAKDNYPLALLANVALQPGAPATLVDASATLADAPATLSDPPATLPDAPATLSDPPATLANASATLPDAPATLTVAPATLPNKAEETENLKDSETIGLPALGSVPIEHPAPVPIEHVPSYTETQSQAELLKAPQEGGVNSEQLTNKTAEIMPSQVHEESLEEPNASKCENDVTKPGADYHSQVELLSSLHDDVMASEPVTSTLEATGTELGDNNDQGTVQSDPDFQTVSESTVKTAAEISVTKEGIPLISVENSVTKGLLLASVESSVKLEGLCPTAVESSVTSSGILPIVAERSVTKALLSPTSFKSDFETEECLHTSFESSVTTGLPLTPVESSVTMERLSPTAVESSVTGIEIPLTVAESSATTRHPLTSVKSSVIIEGLSLNAVEKSVTRGVSPESVDSSVKRVGTPPVAAEGGVTTEEFTPTSFGSGVETDILNPTSVERSVTRSGIPPTAALSNFTTEDLPPASIESSVTSPKSSATTTFLSPASFESDVGTEEIVQTSCERYVAAPIQFEGGAFSAVSSTVKSGETNLIVSYSDSEEESMPAGNQVETVLQSINSAVDLSSKMDTDSEDSINVVDSVPMSQEGSVVDSSPESMLPTESADTQDYEMIFQESSNKNIAFEEQESASDSSNDDLVINTDSDFIQTESQIDTFQGQTELETSKETLPEESAEISRAVSCSPSSDSDVSETQLDLTPSPYVDTPSAFSSRAETQDVSLDLTPTPYVDTPSAFSSKNETQDVYVNAMSEGTTLQRGGVNSAKRQHHFGEKLSASELKSKIQILIEDAISSEEEGDEIKPRALNQIEREEETNSQSEVTPNDLPEQEVTAEQVETNLPPESKVISVGLKTVEKVVDVIVESSCEQAEENGQQGEKQAETDSRSPMSDVAVPKTLKKDSESSILSCKDSAFESHCEGDYEKSTLAEKVEVEMSKNLVSLVETNSPPESQIFPEKSVILSDLPTETDCQKETLKSIQENFEINLNENLISPNYQTNNDVVQHENFDKIEKVVKSIDIVVPCKLSDAELENVSEISSNNVEQRCKSSNIESDVLVDVLENLTEESAKEIFLESNKISEITSKVIGYFVEKVSAEEGSVEKSAESVLDIQSAEHLTAVHRDPELEAGISDR